MHIVIITAVYPPEPVVSARMAQDLALGLIQQGTSVTVLAPQPSRPVTADYQTLQSPDNVTTLEAGVEVVRLPSYRCPTSRLLPRLAESWSFGRHVCCYLKKCDEKPDAIYLNSWPLLAQALIMRYTYKVGIPTVLQIMDIYPESLVHKLPVWAQTVVAGSLLYLDTQIAKCAKSVVVISENMRRSYTQTRKLPGEVVKLIPTWQDDSLFNVSNNRTLACRQYTMRDDLFTFLYLGNIGPVAGVDFLIRAFYESGLKEAQLIIVGDGSERIRCIEFSLNLGAQNIHFIQDPDAANVPLLQSMADIFMLPMKHGSAMSSIPSKLPAYLFSGKPVLATVDEESDTASLIRQAKCGWVGPPEDICWLAKKMQEVIITPQCELVTLGANGQIFAKNFYSKQKGVRRLADAIMSAAGRINLW
ncbi:glycosyltransferase family 4 protein [Trichlorobacter lovleyi]|uniref:Glycosyl transferase group 1 n=1 Tax=Trichlorobacter lovleyi (strain ATCC BAA-1151 / DSM 17278 / SZ) TaxID=398767 RepID=B3E8U3_TRIL1|nr:glycosyltransferase family 4 protein [Trichlorobacter lovleyi]ACD95211.1 glycosyl transferase group 1 [Trichlorobacter lovleyi SZ]